MWLSAFISPISVISGKVLFAWLKREHQPRVSLEKALARKLGIHAQDGCMRVVDDRPSQINAYREMLGGVELRHASQIYDRHGHPSQPWRRICRKIADHVSKAHESAVGFKEEAGMVFAKPEFASKLSLGWMAAVDEGRALIANEPVDLALKRQHQIGEIFVVDEARPKAGVVARTGPWILPVNLPGRAANLKARLVRWRLSSRTEQNTDDENVSLHARPL